MKTIRSLEFQTGSKEEKLPYATPDFPYLASRAELDYYGESFVPWHWHNAIELFFIESGTIKYYTPSEILVFPAGSGGFINSNILHKTEILTRKEKNIQLLHIFEPELIAGSRGNLIEQKYIMPVITASQLEMTALYPDIPEQASILDLIRKAFRLSENGFGYEIKIREALSQIWIQLFRICTPVLQESSRPAGRMAEKAKTMMLYIHEHFSEKVSVAALAKAAFLSERECYRVFQNCLHMSPVEYMKSYRIQMACQMLANSEKSVTEIGYFCGLGSPSYFGKVFHRATGDTPLEYRKKWQNHNKK